MISISNIKKIIEILKNWREKGRRFFFKGSNPHSKWEDFSFWVEFFFERKKKKRIKLRLKNRGRKKEIKKYFWLVI